MIFNNLHYLQFAAPSYSNVLFLSYSKVVPIIAPFSFGDEELNQDESVSTICSITKGDLPVSMWWTLNGDGADFSFNLTTGDGIVITRTSQKVSILNIDAVKGRHRGNYTCFASNKGGVAQHSAYLAITGFNEFFFDCYLMKT